ncbi:MAG: cytochrome-c oxidase, cbb3-type subunit III [Mariprofundaceae bacterium]|nr:cytochrome-c oxidase, cbb3-type subunit III [Mariprofundaceae bacterium]
MAKQDKQPQHAPDTGHEWDGIRELTNPPPRWWMISLHASWIFCVIYFALYPSIPLIHDSTKGILGWTQIKEFKADVKENDKIRAPYLKKVAAMDGAQLLADDGMRNFAESSAKALFGDNCAACHGAGGEGAPGLFPVLADDDWLFGGDIDTIIESIADGRMGGMPAHGEMLSDEEMNQLTDTVIAASEGKVTQEQLAQFDEIGCSGCHGQDAAGGVINDLGSGAANLTDGIWRFGSSRTDIMRTIRDGVNQEDVPNTRVAIMPAFGEKLSPEEIKMLAVKVYQFGGGK